MMIVARGALAPSTKNQHGNRDSVENMPPECSIYFTLWRFKCVSFRNVIRSSFLLDNFGLEIEVHVDGNIETLITGSKNDRTTQ